MRAPAAVGLILWAPGFALTLAIFPAGAIGRVERTVLAVGASVALTAISAVLLDVVGIRLGTASFVLSACVVTWLAAVAAVRRMPRSPQSRRPLRSRARLPPRSRSPPASASFSRGRWWQRGSRRSRPASRARRRSRCAKLSVAARRGDQLRGRCDEVPADDADRRSIDRGRAFHAATGRVVATDAGSANGLAGDPALPAPRRRQGVYRRLVIPGARA